MKVVKLQHAIKLNGDSNIVIESVTVTPECASQWLKCNKNNRPVRRRHVEFLASEIVSGHWQLNGQPIVISENEEVLDGQHRLLAIIEAGIPVKTLVVYGISPEAFKTIDTGAPRTNIDALSLEFPDATTTIVKAVASSVVWCLRLEQHFRNLRIKISNTDSLIYVKEHPTLWRCAETLVGYPKEARPISLAMGTACYEVFERKDAELAEIFMRAFFTGEMLEVDRPEYILRQLLIKDSQRITQYPALIRMRMIVKAWNWRRRGNDKATRYHVQLNPQDPEKLVVL